MSELFGGEHPLVFAIMLQLSVLGWIYLFMWFCLEMGW